MRIMGVRGDKERLEKEREKIVRRWEKVDGREWVWRRGRLGCWRTAVGRILLQVQHSRGCELGAQRHSEPKQNVATSQRSTKRHPQPGAHHPNEKRLLLFRGRRTLHGDDVLLTQKAEATKPLATREAGERHPNRKTLRADWRANAKTTRRPQPSWESDERPVTPREGKRARSVLTTPSHVIPTHPLGHTPIHAIHPPCRVSTQPQPLNNDHDLSARHPGVATSPHAVPASSRTIPVPCIRHHLTITPQRLRLPFRPITPTNPTHATPYTRARPPIPPGKPRQSATASNGFS